MDSAKFPTPEVAAYSDGLLDRLSLRELVVSEDVWNFDFVRYPDARPAYEYFNRKVVRKLTTNHQDVLLYNITWRPAVNKVLLRYASLSNGKVGHAEHVFLVFPGSSRVQLLSDPAAYVCWADLFNDEYQEDYIPVEFFF